MTSDAIKNIRSLILTGTNITFM